jgi:hypothetical protein
LGPNYKNLIVAGNFGCSPSSDLSTNSWQETLLAEGEGEPPTIDVWIYTHTTDETADLREDIDVSLVLQVSTSSHPLPHHSQPHPRPHTLLIDVSLVLQLGYVLSHSYKRYRPKLRVIQMLATNAGGEDGLEAGRSQRPNAGDDDWEADHADDLEENLLSVHDMDAMKERAEEKLRALLKACRIEATALCVPYEAEGGNGEKVSISMLNKFAREISADTKLLFMTLPPLPPADSSDEGQDLSYLSGLAELVAGLPPVALTGNGQGFSVITTEI